MSTIRESEEWDGKAPWNPQWFWPQAILFGFGAAGIVAGLNYRRLGRSRLIWPTIVISSVVFIGVLAGLAFVDRGYVVVTAIIINAPAALCFSYSEAITIASGSGCLTASVAVWTSP